MQLSKNALPYVCEKCNYKCSKPSDWNRHISTAKHNRSIILNNLVTKTPKKTPNKWVCEKCNFKCFVKSGWTRHITTAKHIRSMFLKKEHKVQKKTPITEFICGKCSKSYNARNSLWYHEKKCTYNKLVESIRTVDEQNDNQNIHIINMLLKENQEMRNLVITQNNTMITQNNTLTDIVKCQQTTTNSHNTINSHNKQNYNINMFLTDKCKNAQNLSDFIEVLKTKVDMFKIYENGYVNGISKLFIDELKSMEVTERPLHCTDERRNTFYVHNNDTWNRDENLKDTKQAIANISTTNLKQCVDWSKNIPEGTDNDEHITTSVLLCKEACSGDEKNTEKIIKNISKEIPLNKQVINDV
jgi:hypothetical protein